ncbi:MAG: hypothetical protein QOG04_19 [Actinomycetota bacterium]|jgi:hypothetical protein|nr:hypothetical protein [Actinomycetota bacterium]
MRKALLVLTALTLVVGSIAAPAFAGKSKKGSFTADNMVPYPGPDGCNGADGGMEDVNLVNEPFKAPANGLLTVTMVDFQGDWDLFLNDADGGMIISGTESQLTGAAAEEEVSIAIRKGMEVLMTPCNYAGGPSATVNWKFTG